MKVKIPRSILISVLNWNGSDATVACVRSLLDLANTGRHSVQLIVIDNGSRKEDWECLQRGLEGTPVRLLRQEKNLGFAGGHNIALRCALEQGMDYAWLVNSDAVAKPSSLDQLVQQIDGDPTCGAVSPLILALEDENVIDFCGARHDWANLESVGSTSIAETLKMEQQHPREMWLMGAAILLRMKAIREVGLLNDTYFAYFEDNELCARLSAAGWYSRMAFDAIVLHSHPAVRMRDKGAYYFYLMARNSFKFWFQQTPRPYRRFIRLKLVDRALLVANRLHHHGYADKRDACLLGIYDGQTGRSGAWNLNRTVPSAMKLLRRATWRNHSRHLSTSNA